MKLKLSLLLRTRASALLVTLFLVTILAVSIGGYLYYVEQQNVLGKRSQMWNMALALSEAGIEEGLQALNQSASPLMTSANGWQQNGSLYILHRTLATGEYWVTNDMTSTSAPIITARSFTSGPNFARAGSTFFLAAAGLNNQSTSITRAVRVRTYKGSLFLAALAAKHAIDMNGNNGLTDSYDSSDLVHFPNGQYNSTNAYSHGDVATLDGVQNAVDTGNFDIHGNVATGPNGTVKTGPNGSVSGAVTHDANFSFPDTSLPYKTGLLPTGGSIPQLVTAATNWSVSNSSTPPPAPGPGQSIATVTNTTYQQTSIYPGSVAGLVTNISTPITSTNITVSTTTNCGTTVLDAGKNKPAVGTYCPTTAPWQTGNGANNNSHWFYYGISGYSYTTNKHYTYATNYTYSYPKTTYNYTVSVAPIYTNIVYDYILCGNDYYVSDAGFFSGKRVLVSCPSTLVMADGLNMGGTDTITVGPNGALKLYSDGAVKIHGNGIVNQTGYPANFITYCTTNVTSVSISGNGTYTGILVAPNAQTTLNGGGSGPQDFTGALMAKSIKLNGHFKFHYDEALKRMAGTGQYLITSWDELR